VLHKSTRYFKTSKIWYSTAKGIPLGKQPVRNSKKRIYEKERIQRR